MTPRPTAGVLRKRTVLIVDDHPVFREGLVRIINQEKDLVVCGEAADATEALRSAENLQPDLVVIDISLEGTSGIDLAKSLRSRCPGMRLLVLSMHPESLYAERALRAGASGYVMKRESGAQAPWPRCGTCWMAGCMSAPSSRRPSCGGWPAPAGLPGDLPVQGLSAIRQLEGVPALSVRGAELVRSPRG